MTLAEIRLLAQQRADMVNSAFVTDAEWLAYINGSLGELYDLLLTHYGADYYVATPYSFVTTTAERYALPEDFYKLLGVDLSWPGAPSGYVTLRPFNFRERNDFGTAGAPAVARELRYRLNGNDLWLRPQPAAGQTIVLHYAPRLTRLEDDEDEVDGVSGWEELAIVDAARKALIKEESDTTALEREKAALVARIEMAAENRDAGSPATVVDTSGRSGRGEDFDGLGWP